MNDKARTSGDDIFPRAESFFAQLQAEGLLQESAVKSRLAKIRAELSSTGRYTLTSAELSLAGKLAWRNNARCIGRLTWRDLLVWDRRELSEPVEIFQCCVEHLTSSTNGGTIKPLLTIFHPQAPKVRNPQLIRYADDPEQVEFVKYLNAHGWEPSGEPFQVLPLAIESQNRTKLFELPKQSVLEVNLEHPEFSWFKELGWRWHALPAISNHEMEVGGLRFPVVFSGWYMGTEIGARNLADEHRYNVLPQLAERMKLDTEHDSSLWKDRCLVELNRAVLYSFKNQGVSIIDHHTSSRQFLKFMEIETEANRKVNADWSWIVPPMSGSATPVFHTPLEHSSVSPDFHPLAHPV